MAGPVNRDAGYDDFLDALEDNAGYYLECGNGHGSLPPRRACPTCGNRTLDEQPLPPVGRVETYTEITVATPQLEADTPYVTAVVDFDVVKVTAFVRGIAPDEVDVGLPVELTVEETETTGDRALVARP